MTDEKNKILNKEKSTAIVVEDQCTTWDYISGILEKDFQIKAFCNSSKLAESAFMEYKPDLVWLDCYLGELCESNLGLKNSGLLLAEWMKKHNPETKIILFTASYESAIIYKAEKLGLEAVFLGGKFSTDKSIILDILQRVQEGEKGIYIDSAQSEQSALKKIGKMTFYEFCTITSLLIGKSTATVAEEMNSTRKRINNTLYRVKEKYNLSDELSREEILEELKEIIQDSFSQLKHHNISEVHSMFKITDELLNPLMEQLKHGNLKGFSINSVLENSKSILENNKKD